MSLDDLHRLELLRIVCSAGEVGQELAVAVRKSQIARQNGKIRIDIKLSNTTIGERTEDRIQLHSESTRTMTTVRLGEVVKLRLGKGSAEKQTWAELSVEEVKP